MTRHDSDGDDVKRLVRQHWNGRADTFDDERHHGVHTEAQRERWLSVLRDWTGEGPRQVLDVGCGTGVVSLLLAELGHDVVGVDFAPEMLARAREKARRAALPLALCLGDAERLGAAEDAVDVLTARHLLWTLPNPDEAVREWQRVVRPGGRVLLVEGHWDHDEPWDEYEAVHGDLPMYHGRPPDEMAAFLRQEGIVDVEHEPLQDPVLWGREPQYEYYVMVGTVPG